MKSIDDLLKEGADWPPKKHQKRIEDAQQYHRLFDNDVTTLRAWVKRVRQHEYPTKEFVPYPAAKIAARTIATFLFGEDPEIDSESEPDSLLELIQSNAFYALMQEAAITCAAEGEVYGKVDWDEDVSSKAIITFVSTEFVFPIFKWGRLIECAFLQEENEDETYWRWFEIRRKGEIEHRLYKGRSDKLGDQVTLNQHSMTEDLFDEDEPEGGVLDTGIEDVLVRHIPISRTSRSPHGTSIFDGAEGLISAIHALYSQDQHDAEMAKKRVAISEQFLQRDENGKPRFDRDLDILALDESAAGALGDANKPIHTVEFTDSTVMGQRIAQRFDEFLLACGIAPESAGRSTTGSAESGTARKLAQSLTLQTVGSAGRYFVPAMQDLLNLGSQVTNQHLDEGFPAWGDTVVELADGLIPDQKEQAETIASRREASVQSRQSAVEELHPDWDEEQVGEEVARIEEESSVAIPNPMMNPLPDENEVVEDEEGTTPSDSAEGDVSG